MKTDLDSLSKRLCNAACVAFLINGFYPKAPDWIMGFAMIASIAGLGFMLAHEVNERKRNEKARKPAVETK